jgi:predicted nuclease of predicted toxin-antitoxin system
VDLFSDSSQTRLLGLARSADIVIWDFAKSNGFAIVILDKDFSDLSLLKGYPPKVVWLRCGNSTVAEVEKLIRVCVPRSLSPAWHPLPRGSALSGPNCALAVGCSALNPFSSFWVAIN